MPKILPDIQNTILTIADKHFKDRGFEKADMREIALESNIAVGTVYLHFHNKEALYLQVIKNHWMKTLEKIRAIAQRTDNPDTLLEEILDVLVKEMSNRKSHESLWMEIGSFHHHEFAKTSPKDHFSGMRDPITSILSDLIQKMAVQNGKKMDESISSQLGSFAFIMTVDLCMQGSAPTGQQTNLIRHLLASYISQLT